jgi:hypothetical protein
MNESNLIALLNIFQFIKTKTSFKLEEVQDAILNDGGVLRISTGYTVGDYLKSLEEEGILKYDPKSEQFLVGLLTN